MKSYSHPNVLPLLASFVTGEDLFLVTPYMAGGSVLHIMKYGHPGVSWGLVILVEISRGCVYSIFT